MNPNPAFDPQRSDAIRKLLLETVAADAQKSRAPRKRTAAIVTIAVLVGVIASGTTALALTGHPLFQTPGTPTPTIQPTTPTPTPALTPRPTVDPNPTTAPVRVPATCDDVLPQSTAEGILGQSLIPDAPIETANPMDYVDRRAGALFCSWSEDGLINVYSAEPQRSAISLTIVPDLSQESFDGVVHSEPWMNATPLPELGPNVNGSCSSDADPGPYSCAFLDYANGYGIRLRAGNALTDTSSSAGIEEVKALLGSIEASVAALPTPNPLWEPTGGSIAGATSCDSIIAPSTLDAAIGESGSSEFKSEGGEYSHTAFDNAPQLSAYWCDWLTPSMRNSLSFSASILPGGASYFPESAAADTRHDWQPTTDYPGEAYLSVTENGTSLTILIDGAWLSFEIDAAHSDALPTIVQNVLANVGAS